MASSNGGIWVDHNVTSNIFAILNGLHSTGKHKGLTVASSESDIFPDPSASNISNARSNRFLERSVFRSIATVTNSVVHGSRMGTREFGKNATQPRSRGNDTSFNLDILTRIFDVTIFVEVNGF